MAELMPWIVGALIGAAVWLALREDVGAPGATPFEFAAMRSVAAARRIGACLPLPACAEGRCDRMAAEAARALRPLVGGASEDRMVARGILVVASALGAASGAVIAWSPMGLLLGAAVPVAVCAGRASQRERDRRREVECAMPEAFQALAISLGSGHSLAQALRFVGNHAREPVRGELLETSLEIACGIPAAEALDDLLGRLPAPGLELVATALAVSQRTGAPLGDLLARAAAMVGERMELARRLEVKTAQARLSARLVTAMPLVLMGALALLSPDFRAGMTSPGGAASVGVALLLDAVAWLIIRRIMEVRL